MSKWTYTIVGIVLSVIFTVLTVNSKPSWTGARFVQLQYQEAHDPVENVNPTSIQHFEVWHDKETGQEFTCVFPETTIASADKLSCFPTGRNWK